MRLDWVGSLGWCVLISALVTGLIIATQRWHSRFTHDEQEGVQKFHIKPTPRVAGISIGIAFLGLVLLSREDFGLATKLLLAGLPALVCGLWEDMSKRVSARARLVVTLVSGLIIGYMLDIRVTRTGFEWLNLFLRDHLFISVFITTVYIAGLSNATNIIDGFNGLMLGFTMLACLTLAFVAYQVGDVAVCRLSLGFAAIVLGVFLFNFPLGKIFSGDGGAYFIGFFLSAMALLLTRRNEAVSPMILGSVFIYPLFETVFSMYRRRVIQHRPMTQPDGLHLHSLVYRRIGRQLPVSAVFKNASVAPFIWILSAIPMIATLFFWYSHTILALIIAMFIGLYILLFRRLVSFRFRAFARFAGKMIRLISR
jgi:UDP-N-acetylmuramyl pentapeptide phosphotransferase/UDP-N-acetylglucosamine-1-phosphate transferase